MATNKKHFYLYDKRGDNCGVYIISTGRCAFRSVYDCRAIGALPFTDAALARAHARRSVAQGNRFGGVPTVMGTDSKKGVR